MDHGMAEQKPCPRGRSEQVLILWHGETNCAHTLCDTALPNKRLALGRDQEFIQYGPNEARDAWLYENRATMTLKILKIPDATEFRESGQRPVAHPSAG